MDPPLKNPTIQHLEKLIELTIGILIDFMATRSISISLDAELLKAVDRELQQSASAHQNRSAAMAEALGLWLQKRKLVALQGAYAQLASLEGNDLEAAHVDAATMGQQALETLHG